MADQLAVSVPLLRATAEPLEEASVGGHHRKYEQTTRPGVRMAGQAYESLETRKLASSAAPSWYPVLKSSELRRKSIVVSGRGVAMTMARDGSGLAKAFDRSQPGGQRAVTERYGLVWVWVGSASPVFEVPTVFELETSGTARVSRPFVYRFRLKIDGASVSRILENVFDTVHLTNLHNLRGVARSDVLDQPCCERNDPKWPTYADQGAWFGSETTINVERYVIADRAARLFGIPLTDLRVVSDYWPSGMVGRAYFGGEHFLTVFGAVSPYGRNGRTSYGMTITIRRPSLMRTTAYHALFSIQNLLAVKQDLPVWRSLNCSYGGALVREDAPIIAFRKWYGDWTRAHADLSQLSPASVSEVRTARTSRL